MVYGASMAASFSALAAPRMAGPCIWWPQAWPRPARASYSQSRPIFGPPSPCFQTAELLQTQVGRQGYVSRWGGEEFLIIFKHFTLEESVNFTKQLMEKLHRTELRYHNDCFHVTLTIGVAAGDSEKSIESMVKCADCALYEGKRNGRDQVVCEKQKQSVQKNNKKPKKY